MNLKNRFFFATAALFFVACGPTEPSTQVDCKGGKSVEAGEETYCVFASAITEEGFECPAGVGTARRLGGVVVCSEGGGTPPKELFDALPGALPGEALPTGDCADVLCDLDKTCDAGQCAAPQTEEECIMECGVGCPAPEFQPCASDGEQYCNSCVIECKGLTEEPDDSTCQ